MGKLNIVLSNTLSRLHAAGIHDCVVSTNNLDIFWIKFYNNKIEFEYYVLPEDPTYADFEVTCDDGTMYTTCDDFDISRSIDDSTFCQIGGEFPNVFIHLMRNNEMVASLSVPLSDMKLRPTIFEDFD